MERKKELCIKKKSWVTLIKQIRKFPDHYRNAQNVNFMLAFKLTDKPKAHFQE